jgi:uncharacterized protein
MLRQTVAYARQRAADLGKSLSISMPTNATLLDERSLTWLAENRIQIFLSIDGDEVSQAGRPLASGESSHELARRGLQLALEHPLPRPVAIRMTVTPDNAARQGDNARYFLEQGACELLVYPAMDTPWSADAVQAFASGQRELARLVVQHHAMHATDLPKLKAWRPILRRLHGAAPPRARTGPLIAQQCGAGVELVALAVDGTYAPCHRFVFYDRRQLHTLGDVDRGLDRSAGDRFARLRVEDLEGEVRCVDCDLFDLCTYGCVAISFATTGSLTRVPGAACALMRAQVAACRQVHAALADDPRFALYYLGEPLAGLLRREATTLGARARCFYHEQVTSQAGKES